MFKRASSRLVRTSSKESKDSDVSMISTDSMIRIGRATKTGTLHPNEDRSTVLENLTDILEEEVVTVSEMLEFDLKNSGDLLEKCLYAGVFDGHGGSGCSTYIARNLHQKIAKNLEQTKSETLLDAAVFSSVQKSFLECEDEYMAQALQTADTSGTCAAIALICGKDILVAHTGDCRVAIRSMGETIAVTKDHRADHPGEVKRVIDNGGIIVEGRINGVLCPSRTFGDSDVKSVSKENVLICTPDIARYSVDLGSSGKITSFALIASDGLWDVMDVDEACNFVERALKKTGSADMAAARLVETASKNNHDDVTVIIIAWQKLKPAKEKGGSKLALLNTARESNGRAAESRDQSKDEDVDLLLSPKVSRKKYDPDSKIPSKPL